MWRARTRIAVLTGKRFVETLALSAVRLARTHHPDLGENEIPKPFLGVSGQGDKFLGVFALLKEFVNFITLSHYPRMFVWPVHPAFAGLQEVAVAGYSTARAFHTVPERILARFLWRTVAAVNSSI